LDTSLLADGVVAQPNVISEPSATVLASPVRNNFADRRVTDVTIDRKKEVINMFKGCREVCSLKDLLFRSMVIALSNIFGISLSYPEMIRKCTFARRLPLLDLITPFNIWNSSQIAKAGPAPH
jgi:hypothetical protein